MREKMALDEGVVKYIFPGVHPEVALGEDGYVIYDFEKMYPPQLAVFVPIEVQPSNYSHAFPKSFEDYFKDLDLEISRLSLLTERGNIFDRFAKAEFIPGKVLERQDAKYVVFRFDDLLKPREKDILLCRSKWRELSVADHFGIRNAADTRLPFGRIEAIDGDGLLYWLLPIRKIFRWPEDVKEDLIPMIMESLCR